MTVLVCLHQTIICVCMGCADCACVNEVYIISWHLFQCIYLKVKKHVMEGLIMQYCYSRQMRAYTYICTDQGSTRNGFFGGEDGRGSAP